MKVSIITVNYNDLKGLQKTVESVQKQTFKEFEHIIIDGGSTDGSEAFIYEHRDQFSYSISESDEGVYPAMNKGISNANGEYMLFLNSGDTFYNKNALKRVILDVESYDLIYCNQMVIGADKKFLKTYPDSLSFAYFLQDNIPHQATFIKRRLFDVIGKYDEQLKIISDWKFFLDCVCKHQVTYKHLDVTLVNFYLGGMSSIRENAQVMESEKQGVLSEGYKSFTQDLDNVLHYQRKINTLRRSRIIRLLIKFRFLNKF
ncbi:glycosyltransferase family 2 protein [uncultured Dokdonia sp.]|uniref:glycosyltransferase family 2 protein n=1 Tax=uncultured Dokdonia sp. TaxID=575653 RepID=UPI0030EB900C|tara:strand:+ start:53651 stop:54427 length:777 start_codon:yes stop_codon:yes gene_type:complete